MKNTFFAIVFFMIFGICNITYSADNYALNFDGIKDYVKCGTNNLPEGTSGRTVEAWFKTEYAGDDFKQILSYGAPGTVGAMFGLMTRHKNLSFTQWGAELTGQTVINDGKWHHAAISYDGKEHTMYLDGNFETKGNPQPFNTVLNNCTIGCWATDDKTLGEFFDGAIDEARIRRRIICQMKKSAVQLSATAPPIPGDGCMHSGLKGLKI